uniref:Protein kinase domain-containing protein n=1 Tax=Arcella intermedia TaxID=1963864 RepID=A0A6B2L7Y0_9EUKA
MEKKSFEDFNVLKTIGEGTYGKVYQVEDKNTKRIYAMKVLKKSHLLKKRAITCTITEKDILKQVRHPLIIKLYSTFQTTERVGFVMEYINGGQLFYHMRKVCNFDEDTTRFYSAEIITALEYLHSQHIIHRDLKPENILVNAQGHIVLTDFGLAKVDVTSDEGASTFCGTMEYMPPEMIKGEKYGKPADFWSVGILIYDMLYGQPPFRNNNRKKLQEMILTKKIMFPSYWARDTHSIIKELTMRDPKQRPKIEQIKKHPFFKKINWNKINKLETEAPFKPHIEKGLMDTSNIDPYYTDRATALSPAGPIPQSQEDKFLNFTYVRSFSPSHVNNHISDVTANGLPSPNPGGGTNPH